MVPKLTRAKHWYQIRTHVKIWYQIITHMKNWYMYLLVTGASDKTMKNWNQIQMQLIWGGGYFINVRKTRVCFMKFDFVRIFHKS